MWNRKVSKLRIGSFLVVILIAACVSLLMAAPASFARSFDEKAIADFYRGRTVRIVVGFPPGGPFDVVARVVARHIGKHIPGSPSIIVENREVSQSLPECLNRVPRIVDIASC